MREIDKRNQRNLGNSGTTRVREQEKREVWSGRCPSCETFNEVEAGDIHFESGFWGAPVGYYTKCLDCGYNDVPVRKM